jgi:hypothetical protein
MQNRRQMKTRETALQRLTDGTRLNDPLLLLEGHLNKVKHAGPLTEDNHFLLGRGRGKGRARATGRSSQDSGKAHVRFAAPTQWVWGSPRGLPRNRRSPACPGHCFLSLHFVHVAQPSWAALLHSQESSMMLWRRCTR